MNGTQSLLLVGVLCIAAVAASQPASVSAHLTKDDQARLENLYNEAAPYKDALQAYWALKGLSVLKALPKDTKTLCESLKSMNPDTAEGLYCWTEAAKLINCQVSSAAKHEETLKAALAQKKLAQLYHAYAAAKNLKVAVNDNDVNTAVTEALKTEESPSSFAYAFLLTSLLKKDVDKRYQLIEDVFAQADVIDEKYLQFEGGVFTTALVVEGSFKLAAVAKKAPTLKQDQVVQLANFLLSRRFASKIKSASQLLIALEILAHNDYYIPVAITLEGSNHISAQNKKVTLKVCDVMGGSVGKMALTADSARHLADDAVVLSKKQLTASSADSSLFDLDFTGVKAPFGVYGVQLTAAPTKTDSKLIGLKGSVQLKVVTGVKVDNVEIGVADSDGSTKLKTSKLQYPNKADKKLEADFHQKLIMTFYVKSTINEEALKPHQAFVRLTHQQTGQEIVFVATPADGTKQFKFDMDVGSQEKEFGSLSGSYNMHLVVGDAVIDNPVEWLVAELELTFSGQPSAADSSSQYQAKPIIEHMFRQPEKRPAAVVSTVFTALCLLPFLIMLALWLKLGINVSNFSFSLSAIGFHLGVAGIFLLYFMYFMQLNMFETVKYLTIISVPTFLCGNMLLSSIASKRKAK